MRRSASLTHDVVPKLVLGDVVEQWGEDRQQGDGGVVDVLRDAFHLRQQHTRCECTGRGEGESKTGQSAAVPDLVSTGHFAQFQVLNHLLNVVRSALKELTQARLDDLRTRFHNSPCGGRERRREVEREEQHNLTELFIQQPGWCLCD